MLVKQEDRRERRGESERQEMRATQKGQDCIDRRRGATVAIEQSRDPHDRKRGGYHCHRGEFAGQSFTSKEEMLRQLRRRRSTAPGVPDVVTVGAEASARAVSVRVVRVIDGDTIRVCCIAGREEKIRYIGMDTPEMNHPTRGRDAGAMEATEANRRLVQGQRVRLDLDVQERDRYGRLLAYVWVERAGSGNSDRPLSGNSGRLTGAPRSRSSRAARRRPERGKGDRSHEPA